MTATQIPGTRQRRQRSQLAVPATSLHLFEKAARSAADVVFLDCEDAVTPDQKPAARRHVIAALNDIDWGDKTLQVRINGLDTEYMYRDVIEIVEACPRLDMLLIPKVGVPADVYALDMLVTQIEMATRRDTPIGFDVLIETALGMANVEAIAQSSRRLEALSFGVGDYSASLRTRSFAIGGEVPGYGMWQDGAFVPCDPWHHAQARMLAACRAYGLRAIDGPFGDFSDPERYCQTAMRAAAMGYDGKWAIHPSQIEPANRIFSPSTEEIALSERIMQAMDDAARQGKGAASLDGKLIDIASIRMARNVMMLVAQTRQ